MQIDRRSVARMGFEAFLIVFSVLLALFLDDAWSRHVEEAATREQLASIRQELEANQAILSEWLERHAAMAANVADLRENPPDEPLIVDGRLDFERVFGRSLAESMVRDTAWETAKTTGLVRHVDLECVNLLTDLYGLQSAVREQLWKIGAMLGEREAHQPEHLSDTLVVLEVSLQELQGREYLLAQVYENALDAVDGGACVR
jgi:hypothetical protein